MNTSYDVGLKKLKGVAKVKSFACLLTLIIAVVFTGVAYGQQEITVTGQVTDENNEPLPGATVAVEGTEQGTTTDMDGMYMIDVAEDAVLVFSFVGYQTQRIAVEGRSRIDVQMNITVGTLEELVVVGYGTQRRQDLTGSVASVSETELKSQPIISLDQGLQGRAAGVNVSQTTSAPGGGISVRIRGGQSATGGNEPLYVIDGFPVYSDNSINPTSEINRNNANALSSINPDDIVSIDILKDASATAIYGSRGANGVILITTKEGRAGRTNVDFSSYVGFQDVAKTYDMMNAQQYKDYLSDFAENRGNPNRFGDLSQYTADTDWQDEIFRSAPLQNYQLGVSGGNETTRYALSGNYFDQEGLVVGSQFERFSFRANTTSDINEQISLSNHLTVSRTINNQTSSDGGYGVGGGAIYTALGMAPFIPVKNSDGSYGAPFPAADRTMFNPVSTVETMRNILTTDRTLGDVSINYNIAEGLSLKVMGGVDLQNIKGDIYFPKTTLEGQLNDSEAELQSVERTSWVNENILTYIKTFNAKHSINLTAGYTRQGEKITSNNVQVVSFTTDLLETTNIDAGSVVSDKGSNRTSWQLASYLGRANYTLLDKYLFTFTARADGSSKFGDENKWGFFPSGAMAWRLSNEPFFQDINPISNLKLRVSYGLTGNQEIGIYRSKARLGIETYIFDQSVATGFGPGSVANPDLKWEKTSQFDIGLDLGLFNDRLTFTADYYRKDTEDLLLSVTLPANSGFGSALKNTGSVENEGLELGMNATILNGDFTWSMNNNFSTNKNTISDLGESGEFFGPTVTSFYRTEAHIVREGESLGAFFGYIYDGVFSNANEISGSAQPNASPGDPIYRDTNNDGQITDSDKVVIGSPYPDYTFGTTNTFSYKNFGLQIFLRGMIGHDILNVNRGIFASGNRTEGGTNQMAELVNRWTPQNTECNIPRAGYEGWRRPSTYELEDASFIQLKNIKLSYDISNIGIRGLRNGQIYISAQNLFTITDYSGYNPEVNSNGQTNLSRGLDLATYPMAKTYTIGFSLGL